MSRTLKSFALLGMASVLALATSVRADNTGQPVGMAIGITGGNTAVGATGTIGIGSTANSAASSSARLGIGSNVHHAPAYISTYSAPSFSGGNSATINPAAAVSSYQIPTPSAFNNSGRYALTSTTSNFLGGAPGFVSPPIMFQPNFTPLNYTGLPGSFFSSSVIYPAPLAAGSSIGVLGATRSVGARPMSAGGLLNSPGGGVHTRLSHGVIPNR